MPKITDFLELRKGGEWFTMFLDRFVKIVVGANKFNKNCEIQLVSQ